jgi:uncharacterized cupin superfamily protein
MWRQYVADTKSPTIQAKEVPARMGSAYPPEFAKAVEGREKRALGDRFGLTQFGVNLTTLPPGAQSAQRHWHESEDEFVYVLEGELVLVDDNGEHLLTPGMCAGFKSAVANGHMLVNRSGAPAHYLEIGTRSPNERANYPDIDLVASKLGGRFVFTRKDGTPY